MGLIPGLGRSSGEGNDNPLQYSCLGNPMDRGPWKATVQVVKDLDTAQPLNCRMEVKLIQKKSSGVGRGLGWLRPLHNAETLQPKG